MKYRTGTIYSEITNKGRSTVARGVRGTNKQIYTSRWVVSFQIKLNLGCQLRLVPAFYTT